MLRFLPGPVDGNRGSVSDDDENSLSFDGGSGFHNPNTDTEDDHSSSVSDCESVVSGNSNVRRTNSQPQVAVDGLVRLDMGDKMHELIKKRFVSGLSALGVNTQVESIRRNLFNSSAITQARLQTFQIFAKAVEKKIGGNVNIKYAWFGASKDEIDKIIAHGFGHDNIERNGAFGCGIYLFADHSPLESVKSAIPDDEGTRHVLLCRVLLGKTEAVNPGSTQCHPSSEEFQTGVDNLVSPKNYVVWSTQMNTYILPEFVVSFKTLSGSNGPRIERVYFEKPVSPWIPIPALISALSKILPSEAMKAITQYRRSYLERKVSRRDMIQGIREFAGDRLLLSVLKDFREQQRPNRVGKSEYNSKRLLGDQVNAGEEKSTGDTQQKEEEAYKRQKK